MDNVQRYNNLQILDTVLQLMTYIQTKEEPSNMDVIKGIEKQNSEYLVKIIEQNNKIISMLESSISTTL